MKKGITIAMVILCIGLAGIFVWNRVSSDRKAPEIEIGNEKIVYKEDMDNAELLKGITAKDDKDGDVTDSLVVESIFETKDGKSVTVVYAAKDSSNNVGKVKRSLPCEGSEEGEKQGDSADGQGEEEKQPEAEAANTQPEGEGEQENPGQPEGEGQEQEPQETDTQENDPTAVPADQKAELDALQPQQPKFYLKEYQVTVPVGTNLEKLSYVKDIADDSDNMDFLSRRIQIEDNLNTQVPGTYEVRYYVVDKQGNQSNVARLAVTVQ